MRAKDIDYFENSRRATYVQRKYAIDSPLEFAHYGEHCRGLTASEGPRPATIVAGIERQCGGIGKGMTFWLSTS